MGHTRAYAYVRGAPLPAGGSFQEQMLSETILRERNEKYTLVSLFARLLGTLAGFKSDDVDTILEMYKEELYQFRYNSGYVTQRKKRKVTEAANEAVIANQFRRLENMTVTDDDIPREEEEL